MKKAYFYILNTMADWEAGLAVAELNIGRFFSKPADIEVKTFALSKEPVKTMGGITLLPDYEISDVAANDAAFLILPGAEDWVKPEHERVLSLAKEFLMADITVAAICGATEAMARNGMLDDVEHTSNGLQYLEKMYPDYKGGKYYRDELAVTAGNLITAGSSSSVAFAYHILKKLGVMKPEVLDHWCGYFEHHSIDEVMKLVESLQIQKHTS
jgi:putative intracellular protease/amidase